MRKATTGRGWRTVYLSVQCSIKPTLTILRYKGSSGKKSARIEARAASISVVSERLFAEKIFELRSGDEEEQGPERSEGGLSHRTERIPRV